MYEINVSLNGVHFFATSDRSIQSTDTLKAVLPIFVKKFPPEEGYKVIVTQYVTVSRTVQHVDGEIL